MASQKLWTALNWADSSKLQFIIEDMFGGQVYEHETDKELRDAIAESVDDGTLSEDDVMAVLEE